MEEQGHNKPYDEIIKDKCVSCKHFDYENRDEQGWAYCEEIKRNTAPNFDKCNSFKQRIVIQEKKSSKIKEEIEDTLPKLPKPNPYLDNIDYNNFIIDMTEKGIFLSEKKIAKTGGVYLTTNLIINCPINILYKTGNYLADNSELFTFETPYQLYRNLTVKAILKKMDRYIYKGTKGRDVIRHIFNEKSKELQFREPKYILGFKDKWQLPITEVSENITIINFTPFESICYEKTKLMFNYKETPKQKKNRIEKLREFIKITQIGDPKLAIIIGWSISSIFRNVFIEHLDLFPILILSGHKNTGKTSIGKFWVVAFFKAHDNYYSQSTMAKESRTEDLLSTSTFPIQIDEAKSLNSDIIAILKDTTTGDADYIRKDGLFGMISKPKITPVMITCNELPEEFIDSAMNSKIIHLAFISTEEIRQSNEWINLRSELNKLNFFTDIYEYSKNWTSESIIEQLNDMNESLELMDSFKNLPRIRKCYLIILFGLTILKNIYQVDLIDMRDKIVEELLISSRKMSKPILEQFISYCIEAKEYNPVISEHITDGDGTTRTIIRYPYYLTHKLKQGRDGSFKFDRGNLYDFKQYTRRYSLTMKSLADLSIDALKNKELIKYQTISVEGKRIMGIVINKNLIE